MDIQYSGMVDFQPLIRQIGTTNPAGQARGAPGDFQGRMLQNSRDVLEPLNWRNSIYGMAASSSSVNVVA